jgi:hypothetical protein
MGPRKKILGALAGVLMSCQAPAAAVPEDTRAIARLLKQIHGGTLTERIERFSARFVGTKYSDYALGEGDSGKYDRNPRFRTDAFNCTTFVETVMALALSHDVSGFEKTLDRIRYRKGEVSFATRNHFPCADWIPNNTAEGFLTDITARIAGPIGVKTATALVDRRGWFENLPPSAIQIPGISPQKAAQKLAALHAEGKPFAPQEASVPYIPLDKILTRAPVPPEELARRKQEEQAVEEKFRNPDAAGDDPKHQALVALRQGYVLKETEVDPGFLDRIPSGTILNIVRPNWKIPGTHLNISHQGWVIRKKGVAYFRHTSRSGGERLKDVTLASYLKLCLLSPPIKGINLLQVNAPSP